MPTMAERKSTIRGVEVLIIEPSIGEVFARPNIIHNFRATPISIAAPNIFNLSVDSTLSGFSHIAATVCDLLGVDYSGEGESLAQKIMKE